MHNAMQRNKTICALSNAMILIEAKKKGGSIEAGRECLKMRIPIFAAIYEGMPEWADGNYLLIKQGAIALKKNNKSNRANLENIFSVLLDKNQGLSKSSNDNNHIQNMYSNQTTIFQCMKK
jgi:DNA processing protein